VKDTIPKPEPKRPASLPSTPRHFPPPGGREPRKSGNSPKTYDIGYVHIDSVELTHADGKLVMFLAIDRVSKFTYVEFTSTPGMEDAAFLKNVVRGVSL